MHPKHVKSVTLTQAGSRVRSVGGDGKVSYDMVHLSRDFFFFAKRTLMTSRLTSAKLLLEQATCGCTRTPRIPPLQRLVASVRSFSAHIDVQPGNCTNLLCSCWYSRRVARLGTPTPETWEASLGETLRRGDRVFSERVHGEPGSSGLFEQQWEPQPLTALPEITNASPVPLRHVSVLNDRPTLGGGVRTKWDTS